MTGAIPQALADGIAAQEAGRLEEAAALYAAFIAANPGDSNGLHLLGLARAADGDLPAAEAQFRAALALLPRRADTLLELARVLHRQDRTKEALAAITRALAVSPDMVAALVERGWLLSVLGRAEEAAESLARAARLAPRDAEVVGHHAALLFEQERHAQALACCDAGLAQVPGDPWLLYNRARAHFALGEAAEAAADIAAALHAAPDYADALNLRGMLRQAADDPVAALPDYAQALAINPNHGSALLNRGAAWAELGHFAAAEASMDAARATPHLAEKARWYASLLRLGRGAFAEGWEDYEARIAIFGYAIAPPATAPRWDGTKLAGRRILVQAEQGFGDTLQFCRYVPLLAAAGGRVVLEVQPGMAGIMQTLAGAERVLTYGEHVPVDCAIRLMSLPRQFGTGLASIPAAIPYLHADPAAVVRWRRRLAAHPGRKVGLVWAGGARPGQLELARVDRRRSMTLAALAPLAAIPGLTFVSLQKGPPAGQAAAPPPGMTLLDWTAELTDFTDTAALICALDLVISVDTAVVHLAGALGCPVWLLNRFDSCWRWLQDREDSPWYPTMRLFNQPAPGDWPSVTARVAQALARWMEEPDGRPCA